MARVFKILPGGKLKRIKNRLHGCEFGRGGKDFYGIKERPEFLRAVQANMEFEEALQAYPPQATPRQRLR